MRQQTKEERIKERISKQQDECDEDIRVLSAIIEFATNRYNKKLYHKENLNKQFEALN